jgi:L-lactate dehydrogenase complex protein LldF
VKAEPERFRERAARALELPLLQQALGKTTALLRAKRAAALAEYPEFPAARALASEIRDHVLDDLDHYLELFERNAVAAGARVWWARTPREACDAVLEICRGVGARSVTRSKSMLGEEIGIDEALASAGIQRVETDLGEHILQLAGEPPSHIVAPALHKTLEEVSELFADHHGHGERLQEIPELVRSAREELRDRYFQADVGITGANFLVAESGSAITVTNEGNAELTAGVPRVHVVTAGIEKLVPAFEHVSVLLRLLARSAIGAEISQYTTLFTGPRRAADPEGPEQLHFVLVDNRRTDLLASELSAVLRCIRCGACLNHCPVYEAVGGHAYGWVYSGPIGAVLAPTVLGLGQARDLPGACTLNGRCDEVCPVAIPLSELIRRLRERTHGARLDSFASRLGLRAWAFAARRPALYRALERAGVRMLGLASRGRGFVRRLPLGRGWTRGRDFAAPRGRTLRELWRERQAARREP